MELAEHRTPVTADVLAYRTRSVNGTRLVACNVVPCQFAAGKDGNLTQGEPIPPGLVLMLFL